MIACQGSCHRRWAFMGRSVSVLQFVLKLALAVRLKLNVDVSQPASGVPQRFAFFIGNT